MTKKVIKQVKNGLLGVTERIADLKYKSQFKAPLQDIERADYNLREQLYTLRWKQLTYRYTTDGIFKTMIRQPVLDALRNGVIINSDELNQEDIELLQNILIEKNILNVIKECFILNRLYGGAVLILEEEDTEPSEMLDIHNLYKKKINYYTASRWDLSNSTKTEDYLKSFDIDNIYFNGTFIDKSRVFILKGEETPLFIKGILGGWGLSVAEPLIAPSNIYEKSINLVYQLLDQAKIDIYRIEGFKDTLGIGNDNEIVDRLQLTNILKNFQSALLLDKNDEFEQKQLNMAGIVDIIRELKLDICSAVKIPAVILWGMSPSGFSSGEFDLKQYYSNIESELRTQIKTILLKILKIESKCLFGFIPSDLDFDFYPLLIQSEEQIQNNKDKQFNRAMTLYNNKLLTKKELFEALKQDDIFIQKTKASELDEYIESQEDMEQMNFNQMMSQEQPMEQNEPQE